jgi:hypothetical protein
VQAWESSADFCSGDGALLGKVQQKISGMSDGDYTVLKGVRFPVFWLIRLQSRREARIGSALLNTAAAGVEGASGEAVRLQTDVWLADPDGDYSARLRRRGASLTGSVDFL